MAYVTQPLSKFLASFISYHSYSSVLCITHLNVTQFLVLCHVFACLQALIYMSLPGIVFPVASVVLYWNFPTHSSGLSLNITSSQNSGKPPGMDSHRTFCFYSPNICHVHCFNCYLSIQTRVSKPFVKGPSSKYFRLWPYSSVSTLCSAIVTLECPQTM